MSLSLLHPPQPQHFSHPSMNSSPSFREDEMPSRPSKKPTTSSGSAESDDTVHNDKVQNSSLHHRTLNGDARQPSDFQGYNPSAQGDAHHVDGGESSLKNLGHVLRQILSKLKDLEQVGIESSYAPLPKIALIGDQSSGKSSLVEAITEIQVPRAAGTCTRCPLLIDTTEKSGEWCCTLKVQNKYNYYGRWQSDDTGEPMGSWSLKDAPEDSYVAEISSKEELKEAIWLAQSAILNPHMAPDSIMSKEFHPETNKVAFSPNLIKLEIRGPGLPTLQIYDLPGIITQIESAEDAHLPELVRFLAKLYIEDENTIVVLACAIESDPQTSNAAALIREAEAQHRTLGVLTKADRLESGGSLQITTDLLSNKKFKLQHGYMSTRQPSHQELQKGVTHKKARELERDMFLKQRPWSTELLRFQEQFGTSKLQLKLSHLLASLVTARLPSMKSVVGEKLDSVVQELSQYPKAPDDACLGIVFNLLREFRARVDKSMSGEYKHNEFINDWRTRIEDWRNTLSSIKPTVLVHLKEPESGWKAACNGLQEPISVDSDDETPCPITGTKRPLSTSPATPNFVNNKRLKAHRTGTPGSARKNHALAKIWSLEEILKTQQNARTSGIPTATEPRADEELISKSTENWESPLLVFLDTIRRDTHKHVEEILVNVLREWKQTALFHEASNFVQNHLDAVFDNHARNAVRFLHAERHKPLAFIVEDINARSGKELELIAKRRLEVRASTYLDYKEGLLGKKTEGGERLKKVANFCKDPKELGTDPFKDQIETFARVRGYYNFAADGLISSIGKMQNYEVFHRIQLDLGNELERALKICGRDGLETCKRLLAEDPAREARRAHLEKEKEKLSSAKKLLDEIPVY